MAYFALLADDWHMIFKFDVVEHSLQEYVGDSDQTVILLRLVEWIVLARRCVVL